jgi:hypothetical protein
MFDTKSFTKALAKKKEFLNTITNAEYKVVFCILILQLLEFLFKKKLELPFTLFSKIIKNNNGKRVPIVSHRYSTHNSFHNSFLSLLGLPYKA